MHQQLPGVTAVRNWPSTTRWPLILAVVCAIAFVVIRYAPRDLVIGSDRSERSPAGLSLSPAQTEDLLRHLDGAIAAQRDATAQLERSQQWLDRTIVGIDDTTITARRLQLVRSAQSSAAAEVRRSREELETAKRNLTERSAH